MTSKKLLAMKRTQEMDREVRLLLERKRNRLFDLQQKELLIQKQKADALESIFYARRWLQE